MQAEAVPGGAVCLDIETTGLSWDSRVLCVSAAYRDATGDVVSESRNVGLVDLYHSAVTPFELRSWVQDMIRGKDWVVFHNGSFDVPFLVKLGALSVRDLEDRVFDTLPMARCTGPHEHADLESLCAEFKIPVEDSDFYHMMKGKRNQLAKADPDAVIRYCELDTANTLRLFEKLYPLALEQYDPPFIQREGNFVLSVADMRVAGVKLDRGRIGRLLDEKQGRLKQIDRELRTYGIGSATDTTNLAKFLKKHGLQEYMGTTEKGGMSSDEDSLRNVPMVVEYLDLRDKPEAELTPRQAAMLRVMKDDPTVVVPALILDGRGLQKEISTWLQGFLDHTDGGDRIHPLWGAGGTKSNRINATEPAAQTTPKKLEAWGVDPGYLLYELDYKQAELILMGCYSRSRTFAKFIASGEDLHSQVAEMLKVERLPAKRAVFGTAYGGGYKALMRAIPGISERAARTVIAKLKRGFPEFFDTSDQCQKVWQTRGYITLASGKRLYPSPWDLEHKPYSAFNQLLQGGVAEIIKIAMVWIWQGLPEVRIVAQKHDALLVEIPIGRHEELLAKIVDLMEAAAPQSVMTLVDPPLSMKADVVLKAGELEAVGS